MRAQVMVPDRRVEALPQGACELRLHAAQVRALLRLVEWRIHLSHKHIISCFPNTFKTFRPKHPTQKVMRSLAG